MQGSPAKPKVECEVVFHVKDDVNGEEYTPDSPLHKDITQSRLYSPIRKNDYRLERNTFDIEQKLLELSPNTCKKILPSRRNLCPSKKILLPEQTSPAESQQRAQYEAIKSRLQQLLLQGDDKSAELCINEMLELFPMEADVYFHSATIEQFFRINLDKAAELYERALSINEQHICSLFNLASVRFRQGDKRECERLYRRILFFDRDHCDSMCNLAILYMSDNDIAAETWFCSALQQNPAHEMSLHNYGNMLIAKGKEAEGRALLSKCLSPHNQCSIGTYSMAYPQNRVCLEDFNNTEVDQDGQALASCPEVGQV